MWVNTPPVSQEYLPSSLVACRPLQNVWGQRVWESPLRAAQKLGFRGQLAGSGGILLIGHDFAYAKASDYNEIPCPCRHKTRKSTTSPIWRISPRWDRECFGQTQSVFDAS